MALRLRVLGTKAERLGPASSRVFGVHGGRIGRAADNDWVLPDPERFVSGHHASIEYRGGHWFLIDRSSNGTFVNGAAAPLGRDRAFALSDGDRIRMGEYDFLVSATPVNDFPPYVAAMAAYDDAAIVPDLAIATHGDIGAELDLARLLAAGPDQPPPDGPASSTPTPEPPRPLMPDPPPLRISDAYGQAVEMPRPRPAPEPVAAGPAVAPPAAARASSLAGARGGPRADGGPALQAFCRGAGLDPNARPQDDQVLVMTVAGQLLRELVLGLMTSLQHRAEQKDRFQVADTGITPVDQNPFRSAGSVDELMARLLAARSARYLAPVDAVRSGFADLQRHEIATVSALQDAVAEYLDRLQPDKLEARFEASLNRGAAGSAGNRARYWELYRGLYRVLAQPTPSGLPIAFAEKFAQAYGQASEELKAEARGTAEFAGAVSMPQFGKR
ncbi:MAG: type VI secretion system-associated FHA domain protein TagH [Pseudomonadota bacterium]